MGQKAYRFAADIGGTFTDVVLIGADNALFTKKVLSTPPDYGEAVITGLRDLLAAAGAAPTAVEQVAHATTVATNAVLERSGGKIGLITTMGLRDVLELRRMRFPDTYNLFWDKPKPLVPRRLRREVTERLGSHGEVVTPLDVGEAEAVVRRLVEKEGVEALAVCFLHAYINPVHERLVGEIIRRLYPDLPVSLSSAVLPEIKEYERTSTVVVNAYLMPVVTRYLKELADDLTNLGVRAPVFVMQSNGGMMTAAAARAHPVHILESGPAAGVVGAVRLAQALDIQNAVTFDMGGTTAKAGLIEGGEPFHASEYEVGAPISLASRVLKGGGYLIRVPAIDVAEVGAGGGSVVYVDSGGALHVGPRSAGANPGPACYSRGGTEPTVTDANLVLGYLNQEALLGGDLPISLARAREALAGVAAAINLPLLETAYGVHQIANATMMRAIRAVSTERGRDVRDFALVVYGGNGPVHAAEIARSLGIRRTIVPRVPGVFSALGLLFADVERYYLETHHKTVRETSPAELASAYARLEHQALAELTGAGWTPDRVQLSRFADLQYRGQSYELSVPVAGGPTGAEALRHIEEAFHAEHERTYGHRQDDENVELMHLRVQARVAVASPRPAAWQGAGDRGRQIRRPAYFGPVAGLVSTPVITRGEVGERRSGPLIIEEYDTTVVVPPHCTASLDAAGNILLTMEG